MVKAHEKKLRVINPIVFILIIAFVLRLGWALVVPFDEGSDEYIHYQQVKFIYDSHRLPVFGPEQDLFICRNGIHYASFPGINYSLSALFMCLIPVDASSQFVVARLVSVFSGVGIVLLGFLIAKELFPGRHLVIYGVPFFLAFLPGLIFVSAYVNNDSYSGFAASLALYALIVAVKKKWETQSCMFLGAAVGLVLLGKYTGYAVIPVVLALFFWHLYADPAKLVSRLSVLGLTAFAMAGWWFVRSYHLYDGDLLGFRLVGEAVEVLGWSARSMRLEGAGLFEVFFQTDWWVIVMLSFWGVFGHFGWYVVFVHPYYYLVLAGLSGVLFYALLRNFVTGLFHRSIGLREERMSILLGMCFLCLLCLGQIVYFCWNHDFQPQGRYLLPSAIPIAIFYLVGLESFVKTMSARARRVVIAALGSMLIAFGQVSYLLYVVPTYYLWTLSR